MEAEASVTGWSPGSMAKGEVSPLQSPAPHAHPHVPNLLSLPEHSPDNESLVVTIPPGQGAALTVSSWEAWCDRPIVVQDTPGSIGLRVEPLSVRDVAQIVGPLTPVRVIDVRHQEELDGWRLGDLADYFEERANDNHQQPPNPLEPRTAPRPARLSRRSCSHQDPPARVLNQISLELSRTALANRITPPQLVRDLSWVHQAWPDQQPPLATQLYCLTSAAGAYTDWHVDFGGTSVWYHVVAGQKVFALLPPTEEHLRIYEKWLGSKEQELTFLPSLMPDRDTFQLTLKAGETLLIPSGWIHAVYTVEDSVVFGGNFLHSWAVGMQLQAQAMEERCRVPQSMRFPCLSELHWYVASMCLNRLRRGEVSSPRERSQMKLLMEHLQARWSTQTTPTLSKRTADMTMDWVALDAARRCGCDSLEAMLASFWRDKLSDITEAESGQASPGISPPTRPKLRLKVSSHSRREEKDSGAETGIRIKLSTASMIPSDLPRALVGPTSKEDTDWVDHSADVADEEWRPSSGRIRTAIKRKGQWKDSQRLDQSACRPKVSKVRDRLMKKLR